MRIAIAGSAPSTCDLAPWRDPDWQVWGLAWRTLPRIDRVFEVHAPGLWPSYAPERYLARLQGYGARLMLQEANPDLPEACLIHKEEIEAQIKGVDIWTSSIAFMLAQAYYERPEEIAIYGVDLLEEDEYGHQRPTLEYLIGFIRGRGIPVYVPENSALCKTNYVYGLESEGLHRKPMGLTEKLLTARLHVYEADRRATQDRLNGEIARMNTLDGAMDESRALLKLVKQYGRGGVIPGAE
jgi:hypothetical protein